jgi:hypothetical protein
LLEFVQRSVVRAKATRHRAILIASSVAVLTTLLAVVALVMAFRAQTEVMHLQFVDNEHDADEAYNSGDFNQAIARYQANILTGERLVAMDLNPQLKYNLARDHAILGLAFLSRGGGTDPKLGHNELQTARAMVSQLEQANIADPQVRTEVAALDAKLQAYSGY